MLISKAEANKAAANRSIWHGQAHGPDPYRTNMDKIKEERTVKPSKEERKKFIKKENSLKPIGVKREIIGEKQADGYTPSYYKTEDWKSRSKALIEKAGGKCSKCNYEGKGLTMHHLTYAYKPHTEPEEVLECLCKDCHHLKHEINRIIHGSSSKKIDQPHDLWLGKHHHDKRIKTQVEKFAPWIGLDGRIPLSSVGMKFMDEQGKRAFRAFNEKLKDFLNVEKLEKMQKETPSRRQLRESSRASALVIKSYQVSTSGDTRQHKDKMRKSFGLSWKRFKKRWEGRVTDEELKRFTEYCEDNGIEHTVD